MTKFGKVLASLATASVMFLSIALGSLALELRSDAKKVTASVQQTLVASQTTIQNLNTTVTALERTVKIAGGAINIVRDDLRDESTTLVAANKSTLQAMTDLDVLVKHADASQLQIVTSVQQTLKSVQETTAAVIPVMQATQKNLETLQPVIAQAQVLMKNSSDTMSNVSKSTADVATEIHRFVYPPPAKWYQKYIFSPAKILMHMVTVPV